MRAASPGSPEPLGVTLARDGVNVAVASAHADAIEFCVFDDTGTTEVARIALPARTGDVCHGFVPGIAAGARYGLRAHGRWAPHDGHRFDPAKLLVDPYARALDRAFALHPSLLPGAVGPLVRDGVDSGPFVPKGIVVAAPAPVADTRPRVPWADTIVYELHVRGYTRMHPGVPDALRGTCAGLAHPAAIAHLRHLGVTTVELLPIAAAVDEPHLWRHGLANHWGYNPVAFLVPDPRLAPGGIAELRDGEQALHAAGIEVVLDAVLNHTGEGDALGPTLSLRGLDNATYYRTLAEDRARYVDDAGCGNTVALERPLPLRLALDALRYYAQVAGVDGFRFDLATTLARRADGFDPLAPFLQAVAQDPVLRDLKLIAEPWDVGPGGHRLGAFPPAWVEWNDRYRDTVRRFWRGDGGLAGSLATCLAGSGAVFAPRARPPWCSLNFVAAHDGFTLADLVSHVTKHNEANNEGNRDGTDANYSWNHGVEGPTPDADVVARRRRDVRNLLATLLLSRGTPMLAMGDELGRTQRGNNNAYAQDNPLAWVDWAHADLQLIDFTAALIALRRAQPALRDDRWLTGEPVDASGIADVAWLRADGETMREADWHDPALRTLIAVLYRARDDGTPAGRVGIVIHAGADPVALKWPRPREGFVWRRCIDTAGRDGVADGVADGVPDADALVVEPRSVVALVEAPEPADTLRRRRATAVEPELLARLARAAGIAPDWWEISGARHVVHADTTRALLAAMGLPAATAGDARDHLAALSALRCARPLPAMVVARDGAPPVIPIAFGSGDPRPRRSLRLVRENGEAERILLVRDALPRDVASAADGRSVHRRLLALPPLAPGVHLLQFDDDPAMACRIVVAPRQCFVPPALRHGGRRFGLAAHLYALRRAGDQGIGDFTTLAHACAATARAGGSLVGVNPLHALFPADRERASPYHPSDRRFLDPIYLDVARVPELADSDAARSTLARERAALALPAASADVDYARVWQAKRAVLDACFAQFERLPQDDARVAAFEHYVAEGGNPLVRFALFEAIASEHAQVPWQRWPAALRRPDTAEAIAFAARHARAIRGFMYRQWLADTQLADAARDARAAGLALGLYRDLAVGAAPDGCEPWSDPGAFVAGVSIGAPPDPFAPGGQVWGLPPPNPLVMEASACAGFR
ncbi:MAG: glycogen debranching protein GlgX, partial [Betaproteobacteria bacterium]